MNGSLFIQSQLLATKFFVPVASGTLIWRPRLTALLDESLKYPLTLVSAPAGFGKTMLLSAWVQSLPASNPVIAWVSLDEGDNEPEQFWTYVLSALSDQQPERFTFLLKYLQSPQAPSLKYVLKVLINLLRDSTERFVLILDDYHVITEQQVHTTLSYLVEHLPAQLHIILATRTDPSLPLSLLRARGQLLEVRTKQLRCTAGEARSFFQEVMGVQFPDEVIQEVTTRTEGWLVGLQLLGLSLRGRANPVTLLEETSGDQRYILDYLIDEVLRQQPQDVQTFLLSTCILERLNASLCDAVMERAGSQQQLERLEQTNLFVVALDSRRQWYRYHALFAEALRNRLEHTQGDLVLTLHYRASLWYAQHGQTTQAILHAFSAHQWQWAADLIEREHLPLISFAWGVGKYVLVLLRQWLEQLPADIMSSRPRLCLTCAQMLWSVTPHPILQTWLDVAEVTLTTSLAKHLHEHVPRTVLSARERQEQENLLGQVFTIRAFLWGHAGNGQAALLLSDQALALLSAENYAVRVLVAVTQLVTYYSSSANDAVAAVESGLQAVLLAQAVGRPALTISIMGTAAKYMMGVGQLQEAQRLNQQAMLLGAQPGGSVLPEVGWPACLQADILREWNQLDAARSLAEEAISLCEQTASLGSLVYALCGYAVLLRIFLSCGELNAACSALEQFEHIGMCMNQPIYLHLRSLSTTVDQVRLWLACGELDRATCWAENLDVGERSGTPFKHEREEVARVRIFLAKDQPVFALERLEPALQRATTGKRWDHVIEMWLLQALAYQMCCEEKEALSALSEALRLAEPQGYIRSFVDEGAPMEALLSRLREEQSISGPTPYLDTLLAAFLQESKVRKRRPKRLRQSIPRPSHCWTP